MHAAVCSVSDYDYFPVDSISECLTTSDKTVYLTMEGLKQGVKLFSPSATGDLFVENVFIVIVVAAACISFAIGFLSGVNFVRNV